MAHHVGADTILTMTEEEAIAVTEAPDTMTATVVVLATTIVTPVHQAMADVVMTTAPVALIATLLGGTIDTVVETTIVVETILPVILDAATETLLLGNPMEVETETILQMIGTPVAEFAC